MLLGILRSKVLKWTQSSPARSLLFQSALQHKKRLAQIILLGFAGAILEGLTFSILAVALELLATNGQLSPTRLDAIGLGWLGLWSSGRQFVFLVLAVVICQVIKSILQVANTQFTTLLATQVAQNVQQKVLGIVLDMPFPDASRHKVGELTNFVVSPAESVAQVLIHSVNLFSNGMTLIAYVVVLCAISVPLFIAALVMFGGVVWVQRKVGSKIGALSYQLAFQQGDLSRKVVEGVAGLRLVHAFQRQDLVKSQVAGLQDRFIQTLRSLNQKLAVLGPLSESLLLAGLGGFLLVGFFLFKENRSSLLPDLLTFIAVLNRMSARVSQAGVGWSQIKTFFNRVSIINPLLLSTQSKPKSNRTRLIGPFHERIVFENVGLRYPERHEWALRNIQLTLEKGTSLALVGPSGSGKSSLADLLLGLFEPTEGRILVDGVDLKELRLDAWREQLGVVSQDTLLFNASIKENLQFAKPDASEHEIYEALRSGDALSFVVALPQGIHTVIGERGFMLSGGQRQRLALARALLRNPAILILDEATSALDTNSEQAVQATIDSLPSGGTRVVIAHRLSTIRNADLIVVLNNGSVVESGTHEQLTAVSGLYLELWRKQSGTNQPQCVGPSS